MASGPPPTILLLSSGPTDHFAGVADALRDRDLTAVRTLATDDQGRPALPEGCRVVAVSDAESPETRRAIRLAIEANTPVVQLMDGVVDWRNTLTNPRVEGRFLRPAPAGLVLAATESDAAILRALGNRVTTTGLPRLAAIRPAPRPPTTRLLIATARTPAFDAAERDRLVRTLARLRDAAAHFRVPVLWRLTARLDLELGVTNAEGPLTEALARCSAVLTTPSTLALEARLAGRPTALIDPHAVPAWVRADAIWQPDTEPARSPSADLRAAEAELERRFPMATVRGVGGLWRLVRTLTDTPGRLITGSPPRHADAADRVAAAIAEQARSPTAIPRRAPASPERPAPRLEPAGRPRVVHVYATDAEPLGGVPVWCDRLSDELNARPELGWDSRTLVVSTQRWWRDERTACVIDPSAGPAAAIRLVADSLKGMHPDVVVPHYSDVAHAAAAALRPLGVRTVAAMNTFDDAARALLTTYDRYDAAVAVSDACARWLRPHAGGRPIATIPYGVPVAAAPRSIPTEGPLRIAYVGRMAELQKRLTDLHGVIDGLERRGVAAELHLVGDGPDLDRFLARERTATRTHVRVRTHGSKRADWVQAFWPTVDVAVLVSEAEGMSISMLEAMGHGVVPVVTAVESGATEVIRDGVNGRLAPVGDPDAIASHLAELTSDRASLRERSANAWATAGEVARVDDAAEAWAGLHDHAMATAIDAAPSDHACRVAEPWRWIAARPETPDTDAAWCEAQLRAAGYASIGIDSPCEGDDAVLVTTPPTPELVDDIAAWRESGLGVALAPGLIEPEWVRLAAAIRRAHARGARSIAVYGTGDHTRRAAHAVAWARDRGLRLRAFIDDRPRADDHLGLPVVTPEAALASIGVDAVVLSSDAWEGALWRNTAALRASGVAVYSLYGAYDEEPSSPPARVA